GQTSLTQLHGIARSDEKVELTPDARARIERSRAVVNQILHRGDVVYGISTGFGKFADVRIAPDALHQLQLNLVRSHACGIGPPLSVPEVRAMMLLRANVLALGFSGIRFEMIEMLCQLHILGVHSFVHEKGSVGSSGDRVPLSHVYWSWDG